MDLPKSLVQELQLYLQSLATRGDLEAEILNRQIEQAIAQAVQAPDESSEGSSDEPLNC